MGILPLPGGRRSFDRRRPTVAVPSPWPQCPRGGCPIRARGNADSCMGGNRSRQFGRERRAHPRARHVGPACSPVGARQPCGGGQSSAPAAAACLIVRCLPDTTRGSSWARPVCCGPPGGSDGAVRRCLWTSSRAIGGAYEGHSFFRLVDPLGSGDPAGRDRIQAAFACCARRAGAEPPAVHVAHVPCQPACIARVAWAEPRTVERGKSRGRGKLRGRGAPRPAWPHCIRCAVGREGLSRPRDAQTPRRPPAVPTCRPDAAPRHSSFSLVALRTSTPRTEVRELPRYSRASLACASPNARPQ